MIPWHAISSKELLHAHRATTHLSLKKLLGGNLKLLSKQEKKTAAALVSQGHAYIFTSWPPPGMQQDPTDLSVY